MADKSGVRAFRPASPEEGRPRRVRIVARHGAISADGRLNPGSRVQHDNALSTQAGRATPRVDIKEVVGAESPEALAALATITESSSDAIFMVDRAGTILTWNLGASSTEVGRQ